MNMAQMAHRESASSAAERRYEAWLANVFRALGYVSVTPAHSIDPMEDAAHDLYCDGCTVAEAVAELKFIAAAEQS